MRTAATRQITALTGLRAFAALAVLFYHLREVRTGTYYDFGWLNTLFKYGYLGVDVFFVLSGFIIYHVYKSTFATTIGTKDWLRFLQNRVARLYPLHLVTLGLMLVAYTIGLHVFGVVPNNDAHYTLPSILHNLLMTHAWFPGVGAPNTPAWSISAEWFAYLIFPVLAFIFARSPRTIAFAAIPLALLGAQYLANLHPLFRISSEFLLGMAMCELDAAHKLGERMWPYASIALTAAAIGSLYLFQRPALSLQVGLFGLIIVALANPRDVGGKMLAGPVTVYLGEISYSIYMGHWFIWSSFKHAGPRLIPWLARSDAALITLAAGSVIVFASLLYHFVEMPGRRLIRAWRIDTATLSAHVSPTNGELADVKEAS